MKIAIMRVRSTEECKKPPESPRSLRKDCQLQIYCVDLLDRETIPVERKPNFYGPLASREKLVDTTLALVQACSTRQCILLSHFLRSHLLSLNKRRKHVVQTTGVLALEASQLLRTDRTEYG